MSTASTPLSDTTGPITTVRDYIAAFNKGDANAMGALCAHPMSILDGMAPHIWHGPTACQDWFRDVLVEGEHVGASDYLVELAEPRHANITGDNAYVVVPTTMMFKVHGKPITQTGAALIVALRKLDDGWRIGAWAWAKGTAQAQA